MIDARRLLAVAGLEVRSGLTGPLFWICVAAALVMTAAFNPGALIPSAGGSAGDVEPFVNSQHALAQVFALAGLLLYGFFASILGGMTVIRDDEARVGELLHATPLTPREYVLGKFAGVLALLGLALAAHVAFAMLYYQLAPLSAGAVRGPFRPGSYLVPAAAFAAPTIVFHAGLAFAVGERTRRPLLVVAVPVATFLSCVFFLWQWTPAWLDPAVDRVLMAVDPTGLRWLGQTLFRIDRGIDYYNHRPLAFDGIFLANRLLTVALPAVAVLASIPHCRRAIGGGGRRRESRGRDGEPRAARPVVAPPGLAALQMRATPPGAIRGLLLSARAELRELVAHPLLWIFVPLVVLTVWESGMTATGALDAPLLPTAGTLAVGAIERITVLLCLLLLFYTVESIEREGTTGFGSILHATPVPTVSLLLAKNLATAAVAVVILAACGAAALALLAVFSAQGQGRVELAPLLLVWGAVVPPTLFAWTAFVTAARAITRSRYVTYALGLGALLGSVWHHTRPSMTWVHNWNLWTTLRWSDMGTFSLNGRALLVNRLLTIATGVFLTALAVRFFPRREPDATRSLRRLAPATVARAALGLAPFALPAALLAGWLTVEVRNGFQGDAARSRAEDYRRLNVEVRTGAPRATLTHLDLRLVLDPGRRSMDGAAVYHLTNGHAEPLARLAFTVGPALESVAWRVSGREVAHEDRSRLHVVELQPPLMPGDSRQVGVSYRAVLPRGMTRNGGGVAEFILPSGVVLNGTPDMLPVQGFVGGIGVDEENVTDPPATPPDFWKATLPPVDGLPDPFTTRIEVSAPREYTVNATGFKTAERVDRDTTTGIWETAHPVRLVNLVAGRWNERRQGDVAVFHHPGHDFNVETMTHALAAARRRYSEWFHPYPWRELRISEYPNMVTTAKGFPTNIPFSESSGFLARGDTAAPLAFVVTAHEASHQWWINLLTPGEGPGADVLIEGMAHYSTLLLLEAELGVGARMELARGLESAYARRRRVDAERPLVEVGEPWRPGDRTVVYDKGAWALWMLHRHLGAEAMLAGVRSFVEDFREGPDHAALHDLLATLRTVAADPAGYDAFVERWFHRVAVPGFRVGEVSLEGEGPDRGLAATVVNVGSAAARVEVAATRGRRFDRHGQPAAAYREARVVCDLEPGESRRLSWSLDFEPERIVVDPDVEVLQLERARASVKL